MNTIRRLLGFLRPFWRQMLISVLLSVAAVASAVGLLGTSAYLIARAALHPSIAELQVAIVGVRFFGIARGVFRYLERLASHEVNFRLLARLRVWFYQAVEPLAPAGLSGLRSGDVLQRAVGDIETLENFYVRVVAPPFTALIVTLGLGAFVGQFSARLGGMLVAGLLLAGVGVPALTLRLAGQPNRQLTAAWAELSAALVETLQGLSDLLAFDAGESALAQLKTLEGQAAAAQRRLAHAGGVSAAAMLLLNQLTLWGMLLLAVPLVRAGHLDGVLLAVIALLTLAGFEAVTPLGPAALNLELSLAAGRRLFALAVDQPAAPDAPEVSAAPAPVDLSVRALTFAYPSAGLPALTGVSFDLPVGRRVALVGPSGAGKTTLLNLLLRFWESPPGSITLGGQDLAALPPRRSRRHFAVVSQNAYFFGGSLRQNLLLAHPGAADADLLAALGQVRLTDWLATLPDGLDTWLGERGAHLSGGERQRLALARALLQQAPILLLDEPTAHLDAATERALLATLNEVTAGRSLLWITHRLTGLENLDEIIVLEDGQVSERGSHVQLAAAGGMYAHMLELQNRLAPDDEAGGELSG